MTCRVNEILVSNGFMINESIVRIASKISGVHVGARTDLLNEIERAFNAAGIYPPSMKQTGPSTYEGEIDSGWFLTVEDVEPPVFKLNGKPYRNLRQVVNEFAGGDVQHHFENYLSQKLGEANGEAASVGVDEFMEFLKDQGVDKTVGHDDISDLSWNDLCDSVSQDFSFEENSWDDFVVDRRSNENNLL